MKAYCKGKHNLWIINTDEYEAYAKADLNADVRGMREVVDFAPHEGGDVNAMLLLFVPEGMRARLRIFFYCQGEMFRWQDVWFDVGNPDAPALVLSKLGGIAVGFEVGDLVARVGVSLQPFDAECGVKHLNGLAEGVVAGFAQSPVKIEAFEKAACAHEYFLDVTDVKRLDSDRVSFRVRASVGAMETDEEKLRRARRRLLL